MIDKIFNIIGYGLNRKRTRELPLIIVRNDLGEEEPQTITRDKHTYKKALALYIYNLFVLFIISWKIIYIAIESINRSDFLLGGLISFPVLISIQYIYGIIYFNNTHIYKKIADKNINRQFTIGICVTLCAAFLLSISSIVLLMYDFEIYAYSELYNTTNSTLERSFIGVFMFFDMIYSNSILAINFTSFVANLLVHRAEIKQLIEKIEQNIIHSTSNGTKIGIIGQDYGRMRDKYGDTVSETSGIFSSLNILGFIHICFLILMFVKKKYDIFHIIYGIIFIVVDLIFIFVLQSVKKFIKQVSGHVSSTPFTVTYFRNNHVVPTPLDIESSMDNTYNINNVIYDIQKTVNIIAGNVVMLDQNIDWFGIQSITDKEWDHYVVFGVEISDSKIIGNIVGLLLAIIAGESTLSLINQW